MFTLSRGRSRQDKRVSIKQDIRSHLRLIAVTRATHEGMGDGGSERDIGVERRTCFFVSTVLLWKMGERLFFRQLAKGDERTAPPLRRPTNKMLE